MEINTQKERAPVKIYLALVFSYIGLIGFIFSSASDIGFITPTSFLYFPAMVIAPISFLGVLKRKKWSIRITLGLFWTFLILFLFPAPLFWQYYLIFATKSPILIIELVIYFVAIYYLLNNRDFFKN